MCMQFFIKIFQQVQGKIPFVIGRGFVEVQILKKKSENGHFHFFFFRIWTSAKPRPMTNGILQSLGLDLVNINVCAKFHHNIPFSSFSHFQNLELGKASTGDKCHFPSSWARSCQYQCVCQILSKHSNRFKSYGHFSQTVRRQNLRKLSGDGHCDYKCQLQFL